MSNDPYLWVSTKPDPLVDLPTTTQTIIVDPTLPLELPADWRDAPRVKVTMTESIPVQRPKGRHRS